jgi:alpha-ribazole phosphatase/probable phosphoglycerate mutase
LEGLTHSEIQNRFLKELQKRQTDLVRYQAPGGGESVGDFSERITNCFERILEEQRGNDSVVVAHGGVNRIILCRALGLDLIRMFNLHQEYGCLNIIDYFPDSTLVRLVNG